MICTKHGVHKELDENCPECVSEEIRAIRAEETADMLVEQEQVSGTDVLPDDCSGCPLYRVAHKDTVSVELTRIELDWLRLTAILAPWSDTEDLAMGNRIYAKLKKLSK